MVALVFLMRRVSTPVWLWWGWGLLSVFWSLAPGNSLVASMWDILYLAAFGAGSWALGAWGVGLGLLLNNLFTTLSLTVLGLAIYVSGSQHYVSGEQAVWLVAPLLAWAYQAKRWRWVGGLLLGVAVYAVLISGARAAYLPLLLVFTLALWRLWREGVRPNRIAIGVGLLIVSLVAVDALIPGHPTLSALSYKAPFFVQDASLEGTGNFGMRLKMWKAGLEMALERPLGTGNGSYAQVIEAYLQDPRAFSRSAHNYFVETLATGGWVRLALLLAIIIPGLWRGWRSQNWPWALGAAGLWLSLAFDVTGYYPSFLMLAFMASGRLHTKPLAPSKPVWSVRLASLAAMVLLLAWWYIPCQRSDCTVTRYRGFPPKVAKQTLQAPPDAQIKLLNEVQLLYPKSAWVVRERLRITETPEGKLMIIEELARNFPGISVDTYSAWAKLAQEAGQPEKAAKVLQIAHQRFPWWEPKDTANP